MSINICIFGVSGYTGAKLLHFLNKHKEVNVQAVFGKKTLGTKLSDLFVNLNKLSNLKISDYQDFNFDKTDLIFSCLPNGNLQNNIIKNLDPKIPIIDLSGDFRLNSIDDYKKFYDLNHEASPFKNKFCYGLSEIYREKIRNKKFVANPGCYPTSILIPLIPLINHREFEIKDIIMDSKSGISGAGKKPTIQNIFSEISGNFFSYSIDQHKHYPEIKQEIEKFGSDINFTFVPHVLPIISGIQSTIYFKKEYDVKDYLKVLNDYYKNEPFIKIYSDSKIPCINDVKNTNLLAMNVFSDYSNERIILVSCIDNLVKGASGQAIQNMNIMFDFDESESLL